MTVVLIRTLVLYFTVVCAMRLMGKKQIGELQPSELVVALLISELAAIPMQSLNYPLLYGFIPILALVAAELLLSAWAVRYPGFRKVLAGGPSILVEKGKIRQEEMRRMRYTPDDLLEEIRLSGISHLELVESVMLETNGKLSVLKVANYEAKQDQLVHRGFQQLLVKDGVVNRSLLKAMGHDESWLRGQLLVNKYPSPEQLYLCAVDRLENMLVIKKETLQ